MLYRLLEPQKAAPLFAGWEETILWSCLSGAMGEIFANAPERPASAMAVLGDFRFFAGEPNRELALFPAGEGDSPFIAVPRDEAWAALLADCWGEQAVPALRYATKKEPDAFDRDALEKAAAALPPGCCLERLDQALFHRCRDIPWCQDWVSQYRDYRHYRQYGLGAVVTKDGEPVSGASSYSGWPGGIEIEIDTREDHRRKGLAHAAGAALILSCLERGWYPSWDAQNLASLVLAEKLGYHFSHQYPVFIVTAHTQSPPTP